MKRILLAALLLGSWPLGAAEEKTITLDELMESAEQWARENLDENALRVLQSADQEKAEKLLADLQKEFQGDYVIDLAALRDAARAILPLLESYEETLPYALWLKTR